MTAAELLRARCRSRATCSLCGKRRMCRMVGFSGVPGIVWMVCRDHEGWEPVEGVDYEEEA